MTFSQRIVDVYDDLTRSERRLADLLLESPERIIADPMPKLAESAAVSKATVARFLRRLGFKGLRDAQASLGSDVAAGPEWRGRFRPQSGPGAHLTSELQNLSRSIEQIRTDELDRAIRSMARCEKLWVVGFGDNYPLAHFARALLIRVKPDIRMIPIGGFSLPEEFASISGEDAMLALGVGRRTRLLRSVMRSARQAGAQVTLITDQAAPVSRDVADVALRCRTRGAGVFDSVVAPVSVLTYLCSAMALRIGEPALSRLDDISKIHEDWQDLLDGDL
ncbi:MurR/RpiR family transcriptional regulator [Mangrovicoccus algicola]|uniref:MurR/RpiR family transcriptional regulator n=1 Tax=Mangrovicoccus algicola TaxID=2771008 RepID=A0A8J7CWS9_9RHOB|nr:MurR/RpiR family transcriptional regulator [Mangrovicoccus algicola]